MRWPAIHHSPLPNRGAVLLLVMIFMLMLAIVATTVMQTAVLEFHMAGNEQFQEEAFQKVRDIATELSQSPENFNLALNPGDSSCPTGDQTAGCVFAVARLLVSTPVAAGIGLKYRITRQGPQLMSSLPVREVQSAVSSSRYFRAAVFEVDVSVDGSEKRLGSAHLVRGVAVRLAPLQ